MSWMEFVVELVRYLAWPIIIFIVVFLLRNRIAGVFTGGIKSAKYGNTEVQFSVDQQMSNLKDTKIQDLQHLIPKDFTGLGEEVEDKINANLKQISGDAEKIDVLVKNLAQQQISNYYEKIYYNIFGSQIEILEHLAIMENGEETAKELFIMFQDANQNNSDYFAGWKFSDYMNFLLTTDLVETNNDLWKITKYGRGFIRYVTVTNLNKNKAL